MEIIVHFSLSLLGFFPEKFETVPYFSCSENEHYMIWSLTYCLTVCIKKEKKKLSTTTACVIKHTYSADIFVHIYIYIYVYRLHCLVTLENNAPTSNMCPSSSLMSFQLICHIHPLVCTSENVNSRTRIMILSFCSAHLEWNMQFCVAQDEKHFCVLAQVEWKSSG